MIRVWGDGDQPPSLRARITRTLDVTRRDDVASVAASAEEIETIVHAWLVEFERSLQTGA